MAFQPLNGNVLLKQVEAEEVTAGGLYLPETAREAPAEGIVEALPANDADEITVGDRVFYRKSAGEEVTLGGRVYRLVPQGDILAKYVEADAIPA
ncbi:MAG TPA: co-chaperone GroES [Anaeromyxobacter sp.]